MSIQRFEGFDLFSDTGTNPSDLLAKNFSVGSSATFAYTSGQFAGSAIQMNAATDILVVPYATAVTDSFVGFFLYIAAAPGAVATILEFHTHDTVAATPHLALKVNTDLSVQVFRDGSTSLGVSAASVLATSTWQFVEMRANIDGASGDFDVQIGAVSVVSGTGVNTRSSVSATNNVNAIKLIGAATMLPQFDDLYIVDTTVLGTHPVTFLGPITVATLYPNADSVVNDFTPVGTGSANYDRVNETPSKNDDTNYVQSATVGDAELYAFDNIPGAYAGATVIAVQTTAAIKKVAPGEKQIKTRMRISATNADGGNKFVTDNYQYMPPQIEVINPFTTTAWTQSEVSVLEAGFVLVT